MTPDDARVGIVGHGYGPGNRVLRLTPDDAGAVVVLVGVIGWYLTVVAHSANIAAEAEASL